MMNLANRSQLHSCWKLVANILQAKVGKESSQVDLSPAPSPPLLVLNVFLLFSAEFEVLIPRTPLVYVAFLDSDLFLRWFCDAVWSWRTGTTRVSGSGGYWPALRERLGPIELMVLSGHAQERDWREALIGCEQQGRVCSFVSTFSGSGWSSKTDWS